MYSSSDPFTPFGSRFPLSPSQGRLEPVADDRPGGRVRPYGMRHAVRPVQADRHAKRPTQKSRSKQTAITNDGQVTGYETDVEHYVEMDEE